MTRLAPIPTTAALCDVCAPWREQRQRIALVPTMGSLHAGHLNLCRQARAIADRVIVTIFVNPTQFGPGEDFESYPRVLDADIAALEQAACADVLFVPAVSEVYPHGPRESTQLLLPALSEELCGASRPGHFNGVAGVVLRLCNIAQPDVLVLGEKDYQQLVLIKWLMADLSLDLEVHGVPIVRGENGLALSSRNQYLSPSELERAPGLYRELAAVSADIRAGSVEFETLESRARRQIESQGFKVDYIEVRDAVSLRRADPEDRGRELIVLGAATLGKARLIDNVRV